MNAGRGMAHSHITAENCPVTIEDTFFALGEIFYFVFFIYESKIEWHCVEDAHEFFNGKFSAGKMNGVVICRLIFPQVEPFWFSFNFWVVQAITDLVCLAVNVIPVFVRQLIHGHGKKDLLFFHDHISNSLDRRLKLHIYRIFQQLGITA